MRRDGFILVPVLVVMASLFLLAAALMSLALADSRTGGHVAKHTRLYYFAEAGAEYAMACLPREHTEFAAYFAELVSPEAEPFFRVSVVESGETLEKRIVSVGFYDGRSREVEVRARLCLLGEKALVTEGEARLGRVTVHGGVVAGKAVFGGGPAEIYGELVYSEMEHEGWGSHRAESESRAEEVPQLAVDFDYWEEAAMLARWPVLEGDVLWDGLSAVPGRALIKGDLVLAEGFSGSGFWVVRGDVAVNCAESEGHVMLLAEGEVALAMAGPVQHLGGSFVLYGKDGVFDRREKTGDVLIVEGVLAGGRLELEDAEVVFNEESLRGVAEMFEAGTFLSFSRLLAEWVDLSPRR